MGGDKVSNVAYRVRGTDYANARMVFMLNQDGVKGLLPWGLDYGQSRGMTLPEAFDRAKAVKDKSKFVSEQYMRAWRMAADSSLPAGLLDWANKVITLESDRAFARLTASVKASCFARAEWGTRCPSDVKRLVDAITDHEAAIAQIRRVNEKRFSSNEYEIKTAPATRYLQSDGETSFIPDLTIHQIMPDGSRKPIKCVEVQASGLNQARFKERDAAACEEFPASGVEWIFLKSALGSNADNRRNLAAAGRRFFHGIPCPTEENLENRIGADDRDILLAIFNKTYMNIAERMEAAEKFIMTIGCTPEERDAMYLYYCIEYGGLVPGQLAVFDGYPPNDPRPKLSKSLIMEMIEEEVTEKRKQAARKRDVLDFNAEAWIAGENIRQLILPLRWDDEEDPFWWDS
jgi:hypothetical protein